MSELFVREKHGIVSFYKESFLLQDWSDWLH